MDTKLAPDAWQGWGPFRQFRGIIFAMGAPKGGDVRILDVRAWGFLTGQGHGALGRPSHEAIAVQEHIADTVVAWLNERFPASLPSSADRGERA